MSMQKYAPIFNIFRVVLFFCVVFSQDFLIKTSDGIEAKLDSSLSITPYLKSILSSEHKWGDGYELTEFKKGNPTTITYALFREDVYIDSLMILSEKNINPNVLEQLFLPLKKVQSIKELNAGVQLLEQSYDFMESETNVKIGRFSMKKLMALIEPAYHFENRFSGLLGMSNEKNNMNVSGNLQFHFENLWKTAGTIDIQFNRWKTESEKLFLSLVEPIIFQLPFGGKLEYQYEVNEGLYVKTKSSLGVLSRGFKFGNWEFTGANTLIEPTETGLGIGLNLLREQSFKVRHSFKLQEQNWQPDKGLNMNTMISLGRLSVKDESYATVELNHLTETIQLIGFKSGIRSKMEFKGLWSNRSSLEWSQLIRFGGVGNLRGYRENQFFSEWVILPSIEIFRYATNKTSLSIFTEGAIQEDYNPFPWNYGVSLDQNYANNHITISLAWGREDSFSQGKVHINFINIL